MYVCMYVRMYVEKLLFGESTTTYSVSKKDSALQRTRRLLAAADTYTSAVHTT